MPWMIPAAMVGSAAISGGMGMMAANQANKSAAANMSLQAALANQQMELASRQLNAQLAKQTDAQGNQTVYDPTTNQWVSILSPIGRQLQQATDKEQLLRLTEDANMRRRGMQDNELRRQDEGRLADALMRQYQYVQSNPRDMGDEMTSQLRLANMQGTANANDEFRRNYSMQGLRTGMSSGAMEEGLRQIGKQHANTVNTLNADAPIQGMQLGQAMAAARMGDTLNQYNMLASRASNYEDTPFTPSNINNTLSAAIANQRAAAADGFNSAIGATANASNMMQRAYAPFMQPDDTAAKFVGGMGNRLTDWMMMNEMGMFDKSSASSRTNTGSTKLVRGGY